MAGFLQSISARDVRYGGDPSLDDEGVKVVLQFCPSVLDDLVDLVRGISSYL